MKVSCLKAAMLLLPLSAGVLWANAAIDPETKLKIAPGFETVKTTCTVCHGASQIVNTGMSREVWLETIRWMQQEQGLWEFTPEVEKEILDYLETNYPTKM